MKYFIIARHSSTGYPVPIVEVDDDGTERIELHDSFDEAESAAIGQILCDAGGYEIMEWVL